ncbi:AAA family ATPase [Ruminococcus bicirculans (ex Wegman et al. 2014)]|uniref:EVE domain-containing protein n=1 Tax=Ruminococcus bicirculans (ex Wegman et al. 2014) TaxID=1160721 RepID=A0AAW5KLZ0_9FIRM|nr:AAA family ATPase [Ruminococcus bicirculans (ex Wegman et al. 2014)]MCQ5152934.1 EVE domain-containing protein [Ruminococcus bicirculans (ex Wegman et al. 2014)]
MFDQFRLKDVLVAYKQNFVAKQWGDEKYKWEAVKWFQDNWDVNAPDFAEMLNRSLDKTFNLLASNNNFPKGMIVGFAKSAPEEVRAMFIALFDESKDVFERMDAFKMQSSILLEKYGNGAAQHYQYENAISTYLWLRYPDKYYIYKFGEVKTVASELESDYRFKKGAYADNIRNFLKLYDEISAALKEDTELVNLFQSQLTDTCYPDPELKTLTIDVGFYISRYYSQKDSAPDTTSWYGADFDPGLSIEDWSKLLKDETVFTTGALEIMKRMKDYGGMASCTQLAVKYGETKNFYNSGSVALARRVCEATGVNPNTRDDGTTQWWTILYTGRDTGKDEDGSFIWKLRDELSAALDKADLSGIELYVAAAPGEQDRGYWWLNANPKIWSFADIAVGEVQSYTLYNENGNKRRIFQNFLDAKAGDMIIGYESNPVKQIVAIGRVSAEQDGEKLFFEKVEGLTSPIDYATLKGCPELERMEYFQNPQGSLFKLTRGEYDFILDMIREENPVATEASIDAYTKSDFLDEVYMTEKRYENLVAVLRNKKNIILQGAPGVGKTFAARRLAWSMMGEKDDSRIEFVQFHQNYSYEDFMMGYKPVEDGFELKYGIFYRFCQKAANQPDKEFFFIIDEINRGNMSKIFGELLMLIEKDYRGTKATLAYNGLSFSVPKNLYIIGMMNTADRSLAMIDYALRRRFSFFEVEPGFDSEGFIHYQNSLNNETLNELVNKVKDLNREISLDKSLGKGFCIGHSYFCGRDVCTEEWLHSIVDYDILPMLSEYWFDDANKLQRWENILQGVFQ